MQLFYIGLVKYKLDGTPVIDRLVRDILTYDTEEIAPLTCMWTGFWGLLHRGNYEDLDWASDSYTDPMRIVLKTHGMFPKIGMDNFFIHNNYPLCSGIHKRVFLHIGSKYHLMGGSYDPILQEDPYQWHGDDNVKMMILDPFSNSTLREQMCNSLDGVCTYTPFIDLTSNIDCHDKE